MPGVGKKKKEKKKAEEVKVPPDIRQYVEAILLEQNDDLEGLIRYEVNQEQVKRVAIFEELLKKRDEKIAELENELKTIKTRKTTFSYIMDGSVKMKQVLLERPMQRLTLTAPAAASRTVMGRPPGAASAETEKTTTISQEEIKQQFTV